MWHLLFSVLLATKPKAKSPSPLVIWQPGALNNNTKHPSPALLSLRIYPPSTDLHTPFSLLSAEPEVIRSDQIYEILLYIKYNPDPTPTRGYSSVPKDTRPKLTCPASHRSPLLVLGAKETKPPGFFCSVLS